jgi:hypothetical protein
LYNREEIEFRFNLIFSNSIGIQSLLEQNKININNLDNLIFGKGSLSDDKEYLRLREKLKKIDNSIYMEIEDVEMEKYINARYLLIQVEENISDNKEHKLALLDLYYLYLVQKEKSIFNEQKNFIR